MADPLRRDLVARRNAPFAETWPFADDDDVDVDFTGATVTLQVRQYGAQGGSALVDLVEVGTDLTEGLIASTGQIAVHIDEDTLLFLPSGAAGADVVFEYDLKVQLSGVVAEVWQFGTFTVKPGVTDRLTFLTNPSGAYLLNGGGAYLTGA